ncbi:MAG: alanine racemase [Bdellovibrionaceae bacterium]|nr:alanine racemase [Pseudobdellovibrionaceae bacterium]
MNLFRKSYAEINLEYLKHNLSWIRSHFSKESFFCPMVKGNGYGHGDVIIGKCLESEGVTHMGVCLIEEALWLHQAGIKANILVFRGFDQQGAEEIVARDFIPVVSQWDHLEFLSQANKGKAIPIHVKFDTGMNRLGFPVSDAGKIDQYLWQNKKFRIKGLLTHLHSGEDGIEPEGKTQEQLRLLADVVPVFRKYNPVVHALNSAGILSKAMLNGDQTKTKFDSSLGTRPGLLLYGYAPKMNFKNDFQQQVKPVMALKSHLSEIRFVSKGSGVSYSHTWVAQKDSVIGVVPIGYADGVHRGLSNKGLVSVHDHLVPIIGSICMDYLMIDLTPIMNLKIEKNDSVILFGYTPTLGYRQTAVAYADILGSIPWEMLTSMSIRVPRVIVESSQ